MARHLTVQVGRIGLAILIALAMGQAARADFVDDNLALHLDASNVDGAGTPAIGAPSDLYLWTDLSGAASGNYYDGELMWNGWDLAGAGDGTPANPYAMQFDGASDYVQFPFWGIDENSLSYEVWIKTDPLVGDANGSTRGVVFGEYPSSGGDTKSMLQVTGPNTSWLTEGAQFDHFPPKGGAVNTAPFACPIEQWYQFVVTKQGDQVSMYVNGTLVPEDLGGNPFPATMTEVYEGAEADLTWLGARASSSSPYHPFMGDIALVRIYGDALTGAEVAGNFENDRETFGIGETPDPIPGDANKDGKVTDADAAILATNWQRMGDATWGMGDFNADNNVTDADAAILATHWQEGVEAAAAVPEPTTVVLLVSALLWLLIRRRH